MLHSLSILKDYQPKHIVIGQNIFQNNGRMTEKWKRLKIQKGDSEDPEVPLRSLKDPGGNWRSLEEPGGPWRTLEDPGGPWGTLEDP